MNKSKKMIPYILLSLIPGYIPLIVRLHIFSPGLESFEWFYQTPITEADFFLYYKSVLIVTTAVLMAAYLIITHIGKKPLESGIRRPMIIAAGVYIVCVLLSAMTSPYRSFAFLGVCEDFETVPVVLSYVVIFWFSMHFIESGEDLWRVLKIASPGIICEYIIALLQFAGPDFYQTFVGKYLILSSEYRDRAGQLQFPFAKHVIYGSLYNSNYVPLYFSFFLFIFLKYGTSEKGIKRVFLLTGSVLSFICILGSGSKTGIAAVVIGIVIAGCTFLSGKYGRKRVIASSAAVLVLIAVLIVYYDSTKKGELDRIYELDRMEMRDDEAVFFMGKEELHLRFDEDDLSVSYEIRDGNGKNISEKISEYAGAVTEGAFKGSVFECYHEEYQGGVVVYAKIDRVLYRIIKLSGGEYRYLNGVGNPVKTREIKNPHFFRNSFLSGRGNIWNHSIPLIKQHLIFGSGAGTFGLIYPQDDYIYKEYNGLSDVFDFHAHSVYLQNLLENGFPALVVFLFLPGYFLYIAFKRKKEDVWITVSIITWLIMGLTNDSNVCTTPIYWMILGAAINCGTGDVSVSHEGRK